MYTGENLLMKDKESQDKNLKRLLEQSFELVFSKTQAETFSKAG
jgi:hypothetical protein